MTTNIYFMTLPYRFSALCLFVLITGSLYAQVPEYNQPFAVAQFINPAYAGSKGQSGIQASAKIQFSDLSRYSYDNYLSADFSCSKMPFDIGIIQSYSRRSDGSIREYTGGINIARSFRLFRGISLRAGIGGVYSSKIYKPTYGWGDPIAYYPEIRRTVPRLNGGFVFYNSHFLVGYSASEINRPEQGFYSSYRPDIRHVFQAAFRISPAGESGSMEGFYVNLCAIKQGDYLKGIAGFSYRYRSLKAGVSYTDDNLSGLMAYCGKRVNVSISYGQILQRTSLDFGKSLQLSCLWNFGKENEKRSGIDLIGGLF